MDKLLLSKREAAQKLSISVRSIDYLIGNKKLTARRIGRRVLVTYKSVLEFARADHFEPITVTGAAGD
jgi:excisionase family DNA binding protein